MTTVRHGRSTDRVSSGSVVAMAPAHAPDPGSRADRAASFEHGASRYASTRPSYPDEAVDWLLPPGARRVLDLAAGTGKLTGVLLAEGHQVTAVEPDEEMLSELVRRHGGVRALPGSAERIPLPDGTVDAVLVGQAFHWFDPARALPEIARVLRPGGVIAGLWNSEDDSVGWIAEFGEVVQTSVSTKRAEEIPLPDHPLFTDPAQADFPHTHRRTAESLVATINTHSHALVISAEERARLNERMLAFLKSNPVTANGEFTYPLVTQAKRLVRI